MAPCKARVSGKGSSAKSADPTADSRSSTRKDAKITSTAKSKAAPSKAAAQFNAGQSKPVVKTAASTRPRRKRTNAKAREVVERLRLWQGSIAGVQLRRCTACVKDSRIAEALLDRSGEDVVNEVLG